MKKIKIKENRQKKNSRYALLIHFNQIQIKLHIIIMLCIVYIYVEPLQRRATISKGTI